jgi:hypothetical protein
MLSSWVAHLKVVWDIRGDLRAVGAKVVETLEDVNEIRQDVGEMKVNSAHHESRITALERDRERK